MQAKHPGLFASVSRPETWSSYSEALDAVRDGHADGIGYVLGDEIGAIDLDDCRRVEFSGRHWRVEIAPSALKIIEQANSYTEITPSGAGLRVIGIARGELVHRVIPRGSGKFELYRRAPRFICVTGDMLIGYDRLRNIDDVIDELAPETTAVAAVELRIEPERHDWRRVLVARNCRHLEFCVTERVPQGKRSQVIWKIGCELRDCGATPSEVACVLLASKAWESRGKNLTALHAEVKRLFAKGSRR